MVPKLNLLPLALVSYIMIVYLIATNNYSWYIWLFVATVIFERLLLALVLWIEAAVVKGLAKQLMQAGQAQAKPGVNVPFDHEQE